MNLPKCTQPPSPAPNTHTTNSTHQHPHYIAPECAEVVGQASRGGARFAGCSRLSFHGPPIASNLRPRISGALWPDHAPPSLLAILRTAFSNLSKQTAGFHGVGGWRRVGGVARVFTEQAGLPPATLPPLYPLLGTGTGSAPPSACHFPCNTLLPKFVQH